MKEEEYVLSMMTTYGTLLRDGCKETSRHVNGQRITFCYPEVINNHFKYRHAVDDHNSKRHQPISLEETWATKTWPNRVFAFLLAITEVNVMLAALHFTPLYEQQPPMLEFRKALAEALINNDYLELEHQQERRRNRSRVLNELQNVHCDLKSLKAYKKFKGAAIVEANAPYNQWKCIYCPNKRRTYCICMPGVILCKECFGRHCFEVSNRI